MADQQPLDQGAVYALLDRMRNWQHLEKELKDSCNPIKDFIADQAHQLNGATNAATELRQRLVQSVDREVEQKETIRQLEQMLKDANQRHEKELASAHAQTEVYKDLFEKALQREMELSRGEAHPTHPDDDFGSHHSGDSITGI